MAHESALCPFVSNSLTMPLSARHILWRTPSIIISPSRILMYRSMTDHQVPEERSAPESSSGINSLIAAANKNDRFHLLEDNSIRAGDLDNSIHPIFSWFDCDGPLKQALQLASQFLAHDSLLIFFVPLLYGRELTTTPSHRPKTYLSNPVTSASHEKRKNLIQGVRHALLCLADSIEFRFTKPDKRVYARTLTKVNWPGHNSKCCSVFQHKRAPVIEVAERFMHFYRNENGYENSSRCAQFRHDFLFASTLVHEIVHAVGVMRRGNLAEPCIRIEDPNTEWGYAWEHFVFGCVINPQDRTRSGTNLFMRKIWADAVVAEEAGGKEYSDVSMSYIAQWFREETWDIIAHQGPTAIAPPVIHFKIQSSRKYGAWIVSSDCINIKADLIALHRSWTQQSLGLNAKGLPITAVSKIFWRSRTTEALQESNVPKPFRIIWQSPDDKVLTKKIDADKMHCASVSMTIRESVSVHRIAPTTLESNTRKRKAGLEPDIARASKISRCL